MSVFGEYARVYDLLYRDKDYAGEARYVAGLLQKHAPKARSLLELGCGTGAHAAALAEAGHNIMGVDRSTVMLERAHERHRASPAEIASRLSFREGDIRHVELGRRFDAALALFHVISYPPGNDDLASTFAAARRHLHPGGLFVFDFWYAAAVHHLQPLARLKYLEDENLKLWRFAEPTHRENSNLVDVDYRVIAMDKASGRTNEIKETHTMRYLSQPEVAHFLSNTGFALIGFEEWMTGGAPSKTTWNVVCTARAV